MLKRAKEWVISHYTFCMIIASALALLAAQGIKLFFIASYREAIIRAIGL